MAINPIIKQKAEDIRKKIFGSEVRESLASGIEAISEDVEATIGRQDYVEEQFQDVLDETTGKDVISAPELIAARNGKSNLKTRLDDEHAQVTAQLQQKRYKFDFNEIKMVAHRGLSGVAPENTSVAFNLAGLHGFWGCETDIQLTADGVWVVMHDPTLDRTTNGVGDVANYTLSQLREYEITGGKNVSKYPSQKIPTLEEYLMICKDWGMFPWIEIKQVVYTTEDIQVILNMLSKLRIHDFLLMGVGPDLIQFRKASGSMGIAYIAIEQDDYFEAAAIHNVNFMAMDYKNITTAGVQRANDLGVKVAAWTVNRPEDYSKAVNKGVEIIITDILKER